MSEIFLGRYCLHYYFIAETLDPKLFILNLMKIIVFYLFFINTDKYEN
jgi:hypothetical protein